MAQQTQFLNTPADCAWLRETALRGHTLPAFQSFTIRGNEDCPECVTLYASIDPLYSEMPAAQFVRGESGELVAQEIPR